MRLIEVDQSTDLAPFSRFLVRHRVRHRIYLDSGRQVLELSDARHADQVRAAFEAWRAGRLNVDSSPASVAPVARPSLPSFWQRTPPALATLLGLAAGVYLLSIAGSTGLLQGLTFQPLQDGQAAGGYPQPWRWVTPILLHFSMTHILFNGIVVWELGRRIELRAGAAGFISLVVIIALVSNWAQFLWSGNVRFGGLSGVAYGLLGFIMVASRRSPDPAWRLPTGFAIALLVFLVIFSTGLTEAFGLYIANAAHWGGLLAGAGAALVWPLRRA